MTVIDYVLATGGAPRRIRKLRIDEEGDIF